MKNMIVNSVLVLLAAGYLAGCSKIPSCGDSESLNLVSQIVAEGVTKNTGFLEESLKKRVQFSVEQPIVLTHDEKTDRYTCKGVAIYKISDATLVQLKRSNEDKNFQQDVWSKWRKLMGMYAAEDVAQLVKDFSDSTEKNDAGRKKEVTAEITQVLNLNPGFDDQALAVAVMSYPAAERAQEIQQHTTSMAQAIDAMEEKSKKIAVNVEYTISKIDGDPKKNFLVEANADGKMLSGIQALEVWSSAAEWASQKAIKSVNSVNVSTTTATAASTSEKVASISATPSTDNATAAQAPAAAAPTATIAANPATPTAASAPTTIEASFDCGKASAAIERLICSNPENASADKRLAVAYSEAKKHSSDENKLKAEQIQWMKNVRNKCTDSSCLIKVTEDRIQYLALMGE